MTTKWTKWLADGRPDVYFGKHPKLRSARAYVLAVNSRHIRSLVYAELKKRLKVRSKGMNQKTRECLYDSILETMNHFESKNGGCHDNPRVGELLVALNLVADDLGWQS